MELDCFFPLLMKNIKDNGPMVGSMELVSTTIMMVLGMKVHG